MDGTFFRRALRGQLLLAGVIIGCVVGSFKRSGVARVVLSAIAIVLSAFLAWSGIVTYSAVLVRRFVTDHEDTGSTGRPLQPGVS